MIQVAWSEIMSTLQNGAPYRLENSAGLTVEINQNGTIRRLALGDIIVNLFPGNDVESAVGNLYLRRLGENPAHHALLGPRSSSRLGLHQGAFVAEGEFDGLHYAVRLILAEGRAAWCWQVELQNDGQEAVEYDLVYVQDLALAPYGAIRLNEYYVSQYIDHEPLNHPAKGWVVASRQNQAVGGRYPWSLMGSLRHGQSFATDALQFHGIGHRAGCSPQGLLEGLPGVLLQHEHSLVAIQDQVTCLGVGEVASAGFFGWLEADHPEATSPSDLGSVDDVVALFEGLPPIGRGRVEAPIPKSLFESAPWLESLHLDEAALGRYFGEDRRESEEGPQGLEAFFTDHRTHVVLKAKEERVLRPHGHLLRTGGLFHPDEASLTSTVWMNGVFHSMVTQGHVSINRFLSTTHSYLGLFRTHGLRIFIDSGQGWHLLGLPSAFAMAPEACRWIYRHDRGVLEIISAAHTESHGLTLELRVLEGEPVRCLFSHHVALAGDDGAAPGLVNYRQEGHSIRIQVPPESELGHRFPEGSFKLTILEGTSLESVAGDEALFDDGKSYQQPFLCLKTMPTVSAGLRIEANLVVSVETEKLPSVDIYWRRAVSGLSVAPDAPWPLQRMAEILPWFAHNALIHFLSPRGLEQYSGGGWGTRDVAQGPVEYLLAIGQIEPIRALLLEVFRNQNVDGDWPQWFMFFERERNIRPNDSHGDIVFWPLLACAQYLEASGDVSFLRERVPFFDADVSKAEVAPIFEHITRALGLIGQRLIPGTHLEAYGHGDWNDSLQPADPALREHLCSSWTVTLHYQVLTTLASALGQVGEAALAGHLEQDAEAVLKDFRDHLLVDGVIPGYVNFENPEEIVYLLHPLDHKTGLRYSLLPMIHAIINHMLTPEEAEHHLDLIAEHLMGPDGAHLFDHPMVYRGGPMRIFQRAETATYFGREIGLMYTHAHLRYAEALWQFGDAEGFFEALSKAVPIGIQALVSSAAPRQSNCYFSSSDAVFRDRYQAYEKYAWIREQKIALEGGWRVYSSGAGIASGLIVRALLGLRKLRESVLIDPVIPDALDGLRIEIDLGGHRFDVRYARGVRGAGVEHLALNGTPLVFERLQNPYRIGGARIDIALWREALVSEVNRLDIQLG
jgi:cellobiose phosphorylase